MREAYPTVRKRLKKKKKIKPCVNDPINAFIFYKNSPFNIGK